MSLEQEIFAALGPLVAGRAHAVVFPTSPGAPITPAIIYQFVSDEVTVDICGSGDGDTDTTRFQLDIYSTTRPATRDLRLQVIGAIALMPTPTRRAGGFEEYDSDLKLFRASMDFVSYSSST